MPPSRIELQGVRGNRDTDADGSNARHLGHPLPPTKFYSLACKGKEGMNRGELGLVLVHESSRERSASRKLL